MVSEGVAPLEAKNWNLGRSLLVGSHSMRSGAWEKMR